MKPRVPPNRSPSFAVTKRPGRARPPHRARAAGPRAGRSGSITSSSSVSTRSTVTSPAGKSWTTRAVGRWTSATWLFSCRVTTAKLRWLMLTYSGSGSSDAYAARPVRSTVRRVQLVGGPASRTTWSEPPGGCGRPPSTRRPHLLVPLVLDHDRGVAAVRAHRDRVGLAAHVERGHPHAGRGVGGAVGQVEDVQPAARAHERGRGVDGDQQPRAGHRDRRRLAVEQRRRRGPAACSGFGDVDEPERIQRAVRVDERAAVRAGGDDLGDRRRPGALSVQLVFSQTTKVAMRSNSAPPWPPTSGAPPDNSAAVSGSASNRRALQGLIILSSRERRETSRRGVSIA